MHIRNTHAHFFTSCNQKFTNCFLNGVVLGGEPLAGGTTCLAEESAIESLARGEAAALGDILGGHIGMLLLQPLGFIDTQSVDPLVERTTVLGVDELAEVGAVERQDLTQVHQLKIRITIGLLLLEPSF